MLRCSKLLPSEWRKTVALPLIVALAGWPILSSCSQPDVGTPLAGIRPELDPPRPTPSDPAEGTPAESTSGMDLSQAVTLCGVSETAQGLADADASGHTQRLSKRVTDLKALSLGDLRLVVISADFRNHPLSSACDEGAIRERFDGGIDSVRTIFESASNGQLRLSTTYHPHLQLPREVNEDCSRASLKVISELRAMADPELLKQAEVEVFVLPATGRCRLGGAAGTYGTPEGRKHYNIIWDTPVGSGPACAHTMVYAHELGHSMGLAHTQSKLNGSVDPIEFGDSSGIMSVSLGLKQFQAAHTHQIGWLSEARRRNLQTAMGSPAPESVSARHRALLGALASRQGDAELLEIDDKYVVSYRSRAVAIDRDLPPIYDRRVSIHRAEGSPRTARDGAILEAILEPGQGFLDRRFGQLVHHRRADVLQAEVLVSKRLNLTRLVRRRKHIATAAGENDYLVAWTEQSLDATPVAIRVRRIGSQGKLSEPLDLPRPSGIPTDSVPSAISVAGRGWQDYLVSWSENAPGFEGVYAVLLRTNSGVPELLTPTPLQITPPDKTGLRFGEVAATRSAKRDSSYLVVWEAWLANGRPTIRAAFINHGATGIQSGPTPLTSNTTFPRVACTNDDCLVTSVGTHTVYGTLLRPESPPVNRPIAVEGNWLAYTPQVESRRFEDKYAGYFVVWERLKGDTEHEVVGTRVSTVSGSLRADPAAQIASVEIGPETRLLPDVAAVAPQGFVVTWLSKKGRDVEFHLARYVDSKSLAEQALPPIFPISRPRGMRLGVLARGGWDLLSSPLFLWSRGAHADQDVLFSRLF